MIPNSTGVGRSDLLIELRQKGLHRWKDGAWFLVGLIREVDVTPTSNVGEYELDLKASNRIQPHRVDGRCTT